MKKTFSLWKLTAAAFFALTCFGCINVEYIGQSLPPLSEDAPVAIFTPDFKMPADKYRAIGRVNLTVPDGRSWSAVIDALTEVAREHGADAVNITEIKNVNIGTSNRDSARIAGPNWNISNRAPSGELLFENSFGEPADVAKPESFTEQRIQALVLVNILRYNKELAAHKAKKAAAEKKKIKKTDAPAVENADNTTGSKTENRVRNLDFSAETNKKSNPSEVAPVQIKLTDDRNDPVKL